MTVINAPCDCEIKENNMNEYEEELLERSAQELDYEAEDAQEM